MNVTDKMVIMVLLYILVLIAFMIQFLYIQSQELKRKIIEKYRKENDK